MESSPSSSRFRFRDHQEGMEDSTDVDTTSDISSVSSDANDDESHLQTMTGKGIKRLCSELLELKRASDEDFHKNIFSNYSAFVRIFEEVQGVENELMQLKHHVSTQKRLVKDLVDGIYLKVLSKETILSIIDQTVCAEPSPPSKLEAHTNDVSETLDILLSEHRLYEVLAILEMEAGTFQSIQLEENFPPDVLMSYNSAMSERRAMLADQLTLVAENPRVAAPELQKVLVGLCRLGESHLATQLLLRNCHSRIATGIHDLQRSKSFLQVIYIRELAKLVFSMISQAARSFVMLNGETSPYASELIQWAREETKVFAACFDKYVKSISEISGGLSTAAEAAQFAMSFCSLLETQSIALQPCLIKHIRPCMEEVLQIHIDHFKKVIGIFTAADAWVLGRYLVSRILNEGCSSMVVGQQLEYCLLTNSGRKIVTLLQTITEDVSPLAALQMEGSILRGLMDLFTEYIVILGRAISTETNVIEKGGSRMNAAESLPQQVSVLANLSTLVNFFSSIVRSIFKGITHFDCELMKNHFVGCQHKEIDSCLLFVQEASGRLRAHFCQQFIYRIMISETCGGGQGGSNIFHDVMPSDSFQVLHIELRKLEKLAEDNVVEVDWLMELLRELMETIFVWISNNTEIWTTTKADLTVQHSGNFKQFLFDVQFLVEIARHGGYLSDNIMNASLALVSRMESAFVSAGLDPKRDVKDDGWVINAATEALQKLLEIEKTKSPPDEPIGSLEEEPNEHQSQYAGDSFEDDDSGSYLEDSFESEEDIVAINASEVAINTETEISKIEVIPLEGAVDLQGEGHFDDKTSINFADTSVELEDMEAENDANSETAELGKIEKTKLPATRSTMGIVGEASEVWVSREEGARIQHDGFKSVINKLEDDAGTELPATEVVSTEDSDELQDQDGGNIVEKTEVVSTEDPDELQDRDGGNIVEKAAAVLMEDCDKIQSMNKAETK